MHKPAWFRSDFWCFAYSGKCKKTLMFLNVRFFQGRCQCNLLLFCVSIQSKQKHNTSKHIKTIQIFTNPSSLNMTWVSVSGKLLKVLMQLVFVNGLLNSGPQLCLSHLTFKWYLTNGSHRDGYQTKGDPSTPSWVHWKKEAYCMVEALWTKQTAGLTPGHYSATENVLLLNVLGKSLHNICTTLTQTNVHKHVWVRLVQISYQII